MPLLPSSLSVLTSTSQEHNLLIHRPSWVLTLPRRASIASVKHRHRNGNKAWYCTLSLQLIPYNSANSLQNSEMNNYLIKIKILLDVIWKSISTQHENKICAHIFLELNMRGRYLALDHPLPWAISFVF